MDRIMPVEEFLPEDFLEEENDMFEDEEALEVLREMESNPQKPDVQSPVRKKPRLEIVSPSVKKNILSDLTNTSKAFWFDKWYLKLFLILFPKIGYILQSKGNILFQEIIKKTNNVFRKQLFKNIWNMLQIIYNTRNNIGERKSNEHS